MTSIDLPRTALLVALLGGACHLDATSQPDDPALFERIVATSGIFHAQYPWHWTTPNDGAIEVDARTAPSATAPPPALKKQLILRSLALGYYYALWSGSRRGRSIVQPDRPHAGYHMGG